MCRHVGAAVGLVSVSDARHAGSSSPRRHFQNREVPLNPKLLTVNPQRGYRSERHIESFTIFDAARHAGARVMVHTHTHTNASHSHSHENGIHRTAMIRFWPWLPGESRENISSYALFARQRIAAECAERLRFQEQDQYHPGECL